MFSTLISQIVQIPQGGFFFATSYGKDGVSGTIKLLVEWKVCTRAYIVNDADSFMKCCKSVDTATTVIFFSADEIEGTMAENSTLSQLSDDDDFSSLHESLSELGSLHLESEKNEEPEEEKTPWWMKSSSKFNVGTKKPAGNWLKRQANQSENVSQKSSAKSDLAKQSLGKSDLLHESLTSSDSAAQARSKSNIPRGSLFSSDLAYKSHSESSPKNNSNIQIEDDYSLPTSSLPEIPNYTEAHDEEISHRTSEYKDEENSNSKIQDYSEEYEDASPPHTTENDEESSVSNYESSNVSSIATDQSSDKLHQDQKAELVTENRKDSTVQSVLTENEPSLKADHNTNEHKSDENTLSALLESGNRFLTSESIQEKGLISRNSPSTNEKIIESVAKTKHVTFVDEVGFSLHTFKPSSSDDSNSISVKLPRKTGKSRIAANFSAFKEQEYYAPSPEVEKLNSEIAEHKRLLNAYELENKRLYNENKNNSAKCKDKLQKLEKEKLQQQQYAVHLREQLDQEKSKMEFIQEKINADVDSTFQLGKTVEKLESVVVKQRKEFENKLKYITQDYNEKSEMLNKLREELKSMKGPSDEQGHLQSEIMSLRSKLKKLKSGENSVIKTNTEARRKQQIKDLEIQVPTAASKEDTSEYEQINFLRNEIDVLQRKLKKNEEDSKTVLDNFKLEIYNIKEQYNAHKDILQKQVINLKKELEKYKVLKAKDNSPSRVTVTSLSRECHNKDQQISELKGGIAALEKQMADNEKNFKQIIKSATNKEKFQPSLLKELSRIKVETENWKKELSRSLLDNKKEFDRKYEELKATTVDAKHFECLQQTLHATEIKYEDEITRLKLDFARRYASSEVAKLRANVENQNSMISHLKQCLEKEKQHSKDLAETHVTNLWQMFLETTGHSVNDFNPSLNVGTIEEINNLEPNSTKKFNSYKEKGLYPFYHGDSNKFLHLMKQQYDKKRNQIVYLREKLDEYINILEELNIQEKQG
ncbi:hypothetical protein GQR58_026237 [Nymphon striatum]|nr:hypothetical protein GQR58_026237 [Nymphon striatum]